jgi:hypothetical protein
MRRYGILLKVRLEGGETPYEFSDLLSTRIAEITQTHFGVATNSAAVIETKSIIRKIVRLSYQPTDIEAAATAGIVDQWILLRWRFRQMWIVKIWQSLVQNILEVFTGQAEKRHA